MHYDKHCESTDDTNGVPPWLTIDHPIGDDNVQRVVPDTSGKLERNAMLGEIRARLGWIPFELHVSCLSAHYCTYSSDRQQ